MPEHDPDAYRDRLLAEHTARRDALHTLAAGIAAGLPGDWFVEPGHDGGSWLPNDSMVYLAGPAGQRLLIQPDRRESPQRVEVSGLFTEYSPRWDDQARITAAISRGPAAIATDIARRLLPVYTEQLEKAHGHIAARDARRARLALRAQRLREALGTEPVSAISHRNDADRVHYNFDAPDLWGHVELSGDGTSCNLVLDRVPYETVLLLVAALTRREQLAPKAVAA